MKDSKQQQEIRNIPGNLTVRLKQLLSTILLLTTFNYLNAQDSESQKLSMGIEIGPGLTTFYGGSDQSYQTLPAIGFSGGLSFQVFVNNLISFRSSYLFLLKVEKPKIGELPVGEFLEYSGSRNEYSNFYYLGIPILLQFNFGKKIGYFVNIGPNINFLLKAERFTKIDDTFTRKSIQTVKKVDFGLTAGVGLLIPLNKKFALTFEARNNLNFVPPYNYQESKFYSIDLLLGFSIFNR